RDDLPFARESSAEFVSVSFASDLIGGFRDLLPILRAIKSLNITVLHAHTRLGIFAGWLVHHFSRVPLVVHLHFLARRTWLYGFLARTAAATVIYNSRLTARHYGADVARSHIVMPTVDWPESDLPAMDAPRIVGASALYPHKHLDVVVGACTLLRNAGH